MNKLEKTIEKITTGTGSEKIDTLLKYGNKKLPNTTAIFNLGPAKLCPSMILGICDICNAYGLKK